MKETYFTENNIQNEAKTLQLAANQKQRKLAMGKSALLVLDMQRYFLEDSSHAFVPSSKAIVPGIIKLIRSFLELDYPVIYTKHINTPKNAGSMGRWWRDLITSDSPYSEIIEDLKGENDLVVEKTQYDAFYGTELDTILKSNNIEDVAITGVMTHLCCETTARSAFMHGYQVWFPVDSTATYNRDFHLSTLRNLGNGFAHIVLVDDILDVLFGRGKGE